MDAIEIPRYRVTTPAAVRPITTDQAKAHCRIYDSDDDTYIETLIETAVEHCETISGRAFCTQTVTLTRDDFGSGAVLDLPRAPLQSVTSVKYTPLDTGVELTFSSSNYRVDTATEPGRIVLRDGCDWPSDELIEVNGVTIVYVAGYGTALSGSTPIHGRPATMPLQIVHALLLLIGHWYENREAIGDQSAGNQMPVPMAFDSLLAQHRLGVIV